MVIKTLGAKFFSNLRPYRQHILDPKRGNTLQIFFKNIEEKNQYLRYFFSTPFSNLRPYRQPILDPKRGNTLTIFLQKIAEKTVFTLDTPFLNQNVVSPDFKIKKTEKF